VWLFTWFSLSLETFCCYFRHSLPLWRDFVAIYVVLAFFGEILWLFAWFSPSLERFYCYVGERMYKETLSNQHVDS